MRALSGLIRHPGRLHHVDCGVGHADGAGVTCEDSICRTLPLVCDFADNSSLKSHVVDSRWGRGTLRIESSAGLLVSHRRRHRNPGGASVLRVEDPGESSTRLLSCAAALVMNIAPCSECA